MLEVPATSKVDFATVYFFCAFTCKANVMTTANKIDLIVLISMWYLVNSKIGFDSAPIFFWFKFIAND